MRIGYARVSTDDQNVDMQRRALVNAGCEAIYEDLGISGATRQRPKLDLALAALSSGDVLVVWRLDRLGRSLIHLIQIIRALDERGVGFLSLNDSIDTTSPTGRLMLHISAAFAEFERDLISERTRLGMQAKKARGEAMGRPLKLTAIQVDQARRLLCEPGQTKTAVANLFDVSRTTLLRALRNTRLNAEMETPNM